jgi:predicted nucleotidyltransferase
MASVNLLPDFREFLKLLNDHEVAYLLVGGYAVAYHGYPRAATDMNIWVAIHPHNAQRLVDAIRAFGFDMPELSPDVFLKENQAIRMGVPPIRIEIVTSASGVNFEQCYAARVVDELDGVPVNVINLEHLKINKKATGRHRDLDDLDNLP